METNPLRQYFRQPAIYIRLPSDGRGYSEGALAIEPNGEYPVLPMTTMDEITYRTPDSLFNGTAVISVIQSCMPNVKNAWEIPSTDLDTILIAIRIATYGHTLDLSTQCPSCKESSEYGIDLRTIMERIRAPSNDGHMEVGDLCIHLRSMNYRQMNENSMAQFEDQKMLQLIQDPATTDEQRSKNLGEILKKITAVTTRALAQNIAMVETPQTQVTEPQHIEEWLANCDRNMFAKVRDHILSVKQSTEIPPLDIQCTSCKHEYKQNFTLDMTNFFGAAS